MDSGSSSGVSTFAQFLYTIVGCFYFLSARFDSCIFFPLVFVDGGTTLLFSFLFKATATAAATKNIGIHDTGSSGKRYLCQSAWFWYINNLIYEYENGIRITSLRS